MKSLRKSVIVAAATLATFSSAHAAWTFNDQDTFLAIKATGGTGSDINLFYNLGSSTVLRDGGGRGVNLVNISTDLVAAYGAGWGTRTDLFFGVVATRTNVSAGTTNTTAPGGSDANRVLYMSRNASAPFTSPLYTTGTNPANGSTAGPITSFKTLLASTANLTAQANGVYSLPASEINSFTDYTLSGPNDENSFENFTTTAFLSSLGNSATGFADIQRIDSRGTASNFLGGATSHVATVSIDTLGNISVIPEPSSLMLLGAAGAASLLRRRRTNA